MRGGAADLYGSSAIGGVVDVVAAISSPRLRCASSADVAGASEDTVQGRWPADLCTARSALRVLAAASSLHTNRIYSPPRRRFASPVDAPTQTLRVKAAAWSYGRRSQRSDGSAFYRVAETLNEAARQRATPLPTNATRLPGAYQAGADANSARWGHGVVRAYGLHEKAIGQSFSSITADRRAARLRDAYEAAAGAHWMNSARSTRRARVRSAGDVTAALGGGLARCSGD